MSDQRAVVDRAAGEDVLGRRGFFANVDRARAFGGSSLSGVLEVVGGIVLIAALAIVVVLLATGTNHEDEWLRVAGVAVAGTTSGLMLIALSRLVTYVKACAVLLAKSTSEHP